MNKVVDYLVGFHGISNLVGYSMLNIVYTYIKYMICEQIVCWQHFLKESEPIWLHVVKYFQVLLFNINPTSDICLHSVKWANSLI